MKTFDEFVASSQDVFQASIDKVRAEVSQAAKEAKSSADVLIAALGSTYGHTNRLLRAYHEWLTVQLEQPAQQSAEQ